LDGKSKKIINMGPRVHSHPRCPSGWTNLSYTLRMSNCINLLLQL